MKELILISVLGCVSSDHGIGHHAPPHVFRPSPHDTFHHNIGPAPLIHHPTPGPVFHHSTPGPFHHPSPVPHHPEPHHVFAHPILHTTPKPLGPHPSVALGPHLPHLPAHHPSPTPIHHAERLLHHAPPHPIHHENPYNVPRPYAYEFGVQDSYSGADFAKKEIQDGNGVVTGEYRVALPDGRIQIVTYHADHINGFTAEVSYEGGPPVHPPPPHSLHPGPSPTPAIIGPQPAFGR